MQLQSSLGALPSGGGKHLGTDVHREEGVAAAESDGREPQEVHHAQCLACGEGPICGEGEGNNLEGWCWQKNNNNNNLKRTPPTTLCLFLLCCVAAENLSRE